MEPAESGQSMTGKQGAVDFCLRLGVNTLYFTKLSEVSMIASFTAHLTMRDYFQDRSHPLDPMRSEAESHTFVECKLDKNQNSLRDF